MSPSGASALGDVLSSVRDHVTEQMNGDYEGSGFERLLGAVDGMNGTPMTGQALSDRFVQPRGVPVSMGVDAGRVVIAAIDMTADAVEKKTGSNRDVLSDNVTRMREVISDWLETGPDPDTVPLHLRPDTETADIVNRCISVTYERLIRTFGHDFQESIDEMRSMFGAVSGDLPASTDPIRPVIILDQESAEALVRTVEDAALSGSGLHGFDEISDIVRRIRIDLESDAPSP
jgi:hypothetical protein